VTATLRAQTAPAGTRGGAGLAGRDVLTMADLSAGDVATILETAAALKLASHAAAPGPKPLAGRTVALLFERPSLRTRVSFELGVQQLGGTAVYLGPGDVGLGERESAADVARTLGRWVDAMVVRTVHHGLLEELADAAEVPIINGLTDREHPCQALADLLTIQERFGRLAGLRLAFVGEANNVFLSLARAACGLGVEVRLAHPPAYGPPPAWLAAVRAGAAAGGNLATMTAPEEAVIGADVVYTDTWVSIGSEAETGRRHVAFEAYRVDRQLLAGAPDHAVVMHCLPAHRGEEIAADVLDGPRSIAFDQAENRLHAQKGLLAELLPPVPRPLVITS
jgi:ornithine carbamoyltransferase